MGVKKDFSKVMSRQFKVLLYPDNELHVAAVAALRAKYPEHLGILHRGHEDTKDHWHFAVCVGDNPMRLGTFCRSLGLITEELEPDTQFVRLIGGRLDRFLVYLTHLSEPDKEQYSASDLFGSSTLLSRYGQAATKWMKKEIDMSDAVLAVLDWCKYQEGVIHLTSFARWICGTPYFKASSSPLVRGIIQEHNQRIYDAARRDYINQMSDSVERMQAVLAYPECSDELPQFELDEFEPLY